LVLTTALFSTRKRGPLVSAATLFQSHEDCFKYVFQNKKSSQQRHFIAFITISFSESPSTSLFMGTFKKAQKNTKNDKTVKKLKTLGSEKRFRSSRIFISLGPASFPVSSRATRRPGKSAEPCG